MKIKLTKELKSLVLEAAKYIDNGDPYKDVMDDYDVSLLIEAVAKHIKLKFK